ncbi:hypothetical protein LJC36_05305, partial [Desulfovibrio sp. OttesenSCG-928-C14]|nr:hypothetical protein [Desulfovibrio sp. OttesenSCG-928-C14]
GICKISKLKCSRDTLKAGRGRRLAKITIHPARKRRSILSNAASALVNAAYCRQAKNRLFTGKS